MHAYPFPLFIQNMFQEIYVICYRPTCENLYINLYQSDQDVGILRAQWGGQVIASPYKSNSRGCAILFNNGFEYKVIKSKCDEHGNFTIVEIRIGDKFITLINIYGPNKDTPLFYKKTNGYTG